MLDGAHAPYVLAVLAVLIAGAFLTLAFTQGIFLGGVGAIILGVVLGAEVDFVSFLVRRYFGQALFGRLYGFAFGLDLLGGGTGPILLGVSFDRSGGHTLGLVVFASLGVVAALVAASMPLYAGERGAAAVVSA